MLKRTKEIGYNLGMIILAILIYDVVSGAVMGVASMFYSAKDLEIHGNMIDTIGLIFLFIIFSVWIYQIYCKKQYSEGIQKNRICDKRFLTRILIIVFGLNGISSLWFLIVEFGMQSIPIFTESLQSHQDTWMTVETQPYIWSLLSVVLIGPIVEELLFRGVIFQYLEKIKSGWFPILVSGIAFGLWHGEPVQCVYTAIIGIVYGIIYTKVRDLRILMIMHMLNNFLSTLPPVMDTQYVQYIIGILSYIMVVPAIVALICMRKEQNITAIK